MLKQNIILLIIVVIIAVVPLVLLGDSEFEGADGIAEEAIAEIAPDYEPWAQPLIELPSGEVESLLFSVQVAIGSGILFFILGRMTAKPKNSN